MCQCCIVFSRVPRQDKPVPTHNLARCFTRKYHFKVWLELNQGIHVKLPVSMGLCTTKPWSSVLARGGCKMKEVLYELLMEHWSIGRKRNHCSRCIWIWEMLSHVFFMQLHFKMPLGFLVITLLIIDVVNKWLPSLCNGVGWGSRLSLKHLQHVHFWLDYRHHHPGNLSSLWN